MLLLTKSNLDTILNSKTKISNYKITLKFEEDTPIQNHADTEVWEIHSGFGTLFSNNTKTHVKTGDIILFKPFCSHYVKTSTRNLLFSLHIGI
jgi:mannose-6-phosphate isomerase-like protein (cupin superfamily)